MVPKKRRRKNGCGTGAGGVVDELPATSPRSSSSSRSSSLLQFESLERTCASSYSFDSLEYQQQQRATVHQVQARLHEPAPASPDSLEQDYVQLNGDLGGFGRLRPYRSFESLGEKDLLGGGGGQQGGGGGGGGGGGLMMNGFASHAFGKNCDLSRLARRPRSRRR